MAPLPQGSKKFLGIEFRTWIRIISLLDQTKSKEFMEQRLIALRLNTNVIMNGNVVTAQAWNAVFEFCLFAKFRNLLYTSVNYKAPTKYIRIVYRYRYRYRNPFFPSFWPCFSFSTYCFFVNLLVFLLLTTNIKYLLLPTINTVREITNK